MTVELTLRLSTAMLLATLTTAAGQQPGTAQSPGGSTPDVELVDTATAAAKVIAVDRAKRTVTLQEEGGNPVTFIAGPEVRNFDQIERGDQVVTKFVRATAVSIRKPGEPAGAAETTSAEGAPLGGKPGLRVTRQIEMTATVDDIDYAKRRAVLRSPSGDLQIVDVDPRVQNLESFRKGDDIVIRRTESMLISVTK